VTTKVLKQRTQLSLKLLAEVDFGVTGTFKDYFLKFSSKNLELTIMVGLP